MKDTEVLTECLKKTRQVGWDEYKSTYTRVYHAEGGHLMIEFFTDIEKPPFLVSYEKIVFSYSFAEHFWGMDTMYFVVHIDSAPGMQQEVIGWRTEEEMKAAPDDWAYYDNAPAYEYHLQQIAVEADQVARIAYLEKLL